MTKKRKKKIIAKKLSKLFKKMSREYSRHMLYVFSHGEADQKMKEMQPGEKLKWYPITK